LGDVRRQVSNQLAAIVEMLRGGVRPVADDLLEARRNVVFGALGDADEYDMTPKLLADVGAIEIGSASPITTARTAIVSNRFATRVPNLGWCGRGFFRSGRPWNAFPFSRLALPDSSDTGKQRDKCGNARVDSRTMILIVYTTHAMHVCLCPSLATRLPT
jgi:hypothetical protein